MARPWSGAAQSGSRDYEPADVERVLDAHIEAINALEVDIQRPEGEASEKRWQQARHVFEALKRTSTRKLAAQWRKPGGGTYSHTHVRHTAKTWELHGGSQASISFYEAFHSDEVRKGSVHFSSESAEWLTPQHIVDRIISLFGQIDLDPCSNPEGPNVPALQHFSKDGLAQPWAGRVYMNPPYGRVIGDWVLKLIDEYHAGQVTEAIALVPARTDTDWFSQFRDGAVCFLRRRLKFSNHDNSAPFPSAAVYLGERLLDFQSAFGDLGDVWVRLR